MTTRMRGAGMLLLLACAGCSVGSHTMDLPPIVDVAPSGETQPSTGGQSGTDGEGSFACPETGRHSVAFDEMTRLGTAAPIRDAFWPFPEIPFRWTPKVGRTTTLAIEITWGANAIFVESRDHVCDQLIVPATLRLTTADGLLDETLPGQLRGTTWGGARHGADAQQTAIADELAMRLGKPDLNVTDFGARISIALGYVQGELSVSSDNADESLSAMLYNVARFDSSWPTSVAFDVPYQRPAALNDVCDAAVYDESQLEIPNAAQLLDDLNGTWVKCSGASTDDRAHDGIRFASGTIWTDLAVLDGALTEQPGFGHEGRVELLGDQLLMMDALPQHDISPRVMMSFDRTTLRLRLANEPKIRAFDDLYVRTDMKVASAKPARADGARAGAAACDEGEAHLHRFESETDLRTRLVGAWSICAGGFRSGAKVIVFAEDGTYAQQDESGNQIATGQYVIYDISDENDAGAFRVDLRDDDGQGSDTMFLPALSDAPIKLWTGDAANTVLSALPAVSN